MGVATTFLQLSTEHNNALLRFLRQNRNKYPPNIEKILTFSSYCFNFKAAFFFEGKYLGGLS